MYKVCTDCQRFEYAATTFIRGDTQVDLLTPNKSSYFNNILRIISLIPLIPGKVSDSKIVSCSWRKGAFRTLRACSPPRTAVPSCELVVEVVETMRWCSPAPEASVFARLRHCDDLAAPFFCAVDPRSEQSTILLFATVLQFADQPSLYVSGDI